MLCSYITSMNSLKCEKKSSLLKIPKILIPLVRPSRHYHPLSYRLIIATTDYYNFSKSCISLKQPPP